MINLGKALIKKYKKGMPLGPNDFTQMEYNFSLFFGLAVQLYEATLVADDTPFDRFVGSTLNVRGGGNPIPPDPNALTAQEQQGLTLFGTNRQRILVWAAFCATPCLKPPNTPFATFRWITMASPKISSSARPMGMAVGSALPTPCRRLILTSACVISPTAPARMTSAGPEPRLTCPPS